MHLTLARPTPYKIILEKSSLRLGGLAQIAFHKQTGFPRPMFHGAIDPGHPTLGGLLFRVRNVVVRAVLGNLEKLRCAVELQAILSWEPKLQELPSLSNVF